MRGLINYIRSCFCKHEWEKEEKVCNVRQYGAILGQEFRVSITCKKCGWHKSYSKFGS